VIWIRNGRRRREKRNNVYLNWYIYIRIVIWKNTFILLFNLLILIRDDSPQPRVTCLEEKNWSNWIHFFYFSSNRIRTFIGVLLLTFIVSSCIVACASYHVDDGEHQLLRQRRSYGEDDDNDVS